MKKLFWAMAIYLIVGSVFADNVCQMVPGGILDTFQTDFYNQAQSFATKALPTVRNIYWLLFALWAAYEMSFNQVLGMNIQRLYVWWVARLFIAYTIEHIFLDPTFYVGILKFGAQLGSTMGGFHVNPDSGSPLGTFTPSAIMGINDCVATAVGNAYANINPLNVYASIELLIIQLGFLLVSGLAAFYVLYLSIKIWIALFAGFVNAMFAGNEWTVTWWQQYLSTVIKYAFELMIVAAMFGVIYAQLMAFVNQLTGANADIINNYGVYLKTLAEVGFMVFLLFTLPKEISSSMGGSFGGKLTNLAGKLATKASSYATAGFSGSGGLNPGGSSNPVSESLGRSSSGGAKEVFGGGDSKTTASNPNDWSAASSNPLFGNQGSSSQIDGSQWQDAASKIDIK